MRPTAPLFPRIPRRTFLRSSLAGTAALVSGGAPALDAWARQPAARAGLAVPSVRGQGLPRTLREKVGQLFMVGFGGISPEPGFLSLLERYALGGVILYARNVGTTDQLRALLAGLRQAAPFPLLVSTDQEGGRVARIRHAVTVFPSEAAYGVEGSAARVYDDAATTARDLRALGLTMNLAPVVDLLTNPRSPIGARSYGADPRVAARLSVAAIQGYQQHGLAATAKHFIGLGHASIDSHHALPTVTLTLDELERDDLIPFRAAIAVGVSTVLVAHVALPAIDPVYRPASLSPVVIEGLLRQRLGFTGVIMTDSLVMGALPAGHEAEAPERAFAAGADILLLGGDQANPASVIDEAIERIVSSIQAGRIPESRLEAAVARITVLKGRYPAQPAASAIG